MLLKLLIGVTIFSIGYLFFQFLFDVILRGFAPFYPSRPWVIEAILNNLKLKKYNIVYALGSGRSGFLYAFSKMFPDTKLIGVEYSLFHYIVAQTQLVLRTIFFRPVKIRIIKSKIKDIELSQADFIYSHLYPEHMEGLGKKLKFECQPGIPVVSNGFLIPELEPKETIDLPERKGRLLWISRNREFFKSKSKKSKKENKVFFYEI